MTGMTFRDYLIQFATTKQCVLNLGAETRNTMRMLSPIISLEDHYMWTLQIPRIIHLMNKIKPKI